MGVFTLAGCGVPCSARHSLTRVALLLVACAIVNLAHHQSDHERVNAGNGASGGVSRDGDDRS